MLLTRYNETKTTQVFTLDTQRFLKFLRGMAPIALDPQCSQFGINYLNTSEPAPLLVSSNHKSTNGMVFIVNVLHADNYALSTCKLKENKTEWFKHVSFLFLAHNCAKREKKVLKIPGCLGKVSLPFQHNYIVFFSFSYVQ